ncbi:uncharacterized protein LOC115328407 [Ixodes scapularis]|uniref:uncharacterized protein LOC115328407 n=1 Tax=Ixodes scapularis TaxID=6945 RepID=UPI001C37E878|nr:uncharacterized protein LOC115328407 [Ixodes scapularis]
MKGQRLSDRDYHYWRQKALEYSNGITGVNEKTPQKQAERMLLILEDVDYQRTVLDQLRGQVQEVQRKLSLSLIYLEALKQVSSSKNDPTSLSSMQQQQTTLHYISRQSPYPGTKIQRFPVPDNPTSSGGWSRMICSSSFHRATAAYSTRWGTSREHSLRNHLIFPPF